MKGGGVNPCEFVWIHFGRSWSITIYKGFSDLQWKGVVWIRVNPCEFVLGVPSPSRFTNDVPDCKWKLVVWIRVNLCEFVLGAPGPSRFTNDSPDFQWKGVWIRVNPCEFVWIRVNLFWALLNHHDLRMIFPGFQWKRIVWIRVDSCESVWIRFGRS